MTTPRFRVAGTVLSARNVQELAGFYERLLGWPRLADEPGWVILRADELGNALSFHEDEQYEPPVWPSESGSQMMMFHLDIATDDLDAGVARAIECGATRRRVPTAAGGPGHARPGRSPVLLVPVTALVTTSTTLSGADVDALADAVDASDDGLTALQEHLRGAGVADAATACRSRSGRRGRA